MANVATIIAMTPTYLAFERPSDRQALWSAIPRGLRGFILEISVLDAKPVNDTQTLSLTGTLPPGFAYIFAEIGLRMTQNVARTWDSEYTLNLQNYYQGNVALSMDWNFDWALVGLGGFERGQGHTALDTVPKAPMWASRGTSGVQINIISFNAGAAIAAAGTVEAFINFWEFDLEQARKYPINAPFPVHSR